MIIQPHKTPTTAAHTSMEPPLASLVFCIHPSAAAKHEYPFCADCMIDDYLSDSPYAYHRLCFSHFPGCPFRNAPIMRSKWMITDLTEPSFSLLGPRWIHASVKYLGVEGFVYGLHTQFMLGTIEPVKPIPITATWWFMEIENFSLSRCKTSDFWILLTWPPYSKCLHASAVAAHPSKSKLGWILLPRD